MWYNPRQVAKKQRSKENTQEKFCAFFPLRFGVKNSEKYF